MFWTEIVEYLLVRQKCRWRSPFCLSLNVLVICAWRNIKFGMYRGGNKSRWVEQINSRLDNGSNGLNIQSTILQSQSRLKSWKLTTNVLNVKRDEELEGQGVILAAIGYITTAMDWRRIKSKILPTSQFIPAKHVNHYIEELWLWPNYVWKKN